MCKLLNKLRFADYLNHVDKEDLLETYDRLSKFYDNTEIPFQNYGNTGEVQVKTTYNPEKKSCMIAWECSSNNRVHTNFKISIDWIINFLALPSKILSTIIVGSDFITNDFFTHGGFAYAFYAALDALKHDIEQIMRDHDVERIDTYGWSYGGAMATFTHLYLKCMYPEKKITTCTIGAPKVMFKFPNPLSIPTWIDLRKRGAGLFMFRNRNDIVPFMAPDFMCSRHVVPNIRIGDRFHPIKIFKPQIYHLKETYDSLIPDVIRKM